VSDKVESFSRALTALIESREREFAKKFSEHVGKFSMARQSGGSGLDAIGRLELSRVTYNDAVAAAMESALKFSKIEGVAVAQLLTATRGPMVAFGERIAAHVRFPGEERKNVTADIPTAMTLDRLRIEFVKSFDDAVRDAQAGRVGFARHLPMPFHRATINALRDNPWLLLSHGVSALLGIALGYFGLK
jgi:hypothetical protein